MKLLYLTINSNIESTLDHSLPFLMLERPLTACTHNHFPTKQIIFILFLNQSPYIIIDVTFLPFIWYFVMYIWPLNLPAIVLTENCDWYCQWRKNQNTCLKFIESLKLSVLCYSTLIRYNVWLIVDLNQRKLKTFIYIKRKLY